MCEAGLRRNEEEAEAGGRIPSFPQTAGARAPAPQGGSARKRAQPRHLGASSPSGNVRGGCRGWTPWRERTSSEEMNGGTTRNFVFERLTSIKPTAQMGRSEPFTPRTAQVLAGQNPPHALCFSISLAFPPPKQIRKAGKRAWCGLAAGVRERRAGRSRASSRGRAPSPRGARNQSLCDWK